MEENDYGLQQWITPIIFNGKRISYSSHYRDPGNGRNENNNQVDRSLSEISFPICFTVFFSNDFFRSRV